MPLALGRNEHGYELQTEGKRGELTYAHRFCNRLLRRPAPAGTDACCVQDAEVKSSGGTGCGCGSAPRRDPPTKVACCT